MIPIVDMLQLILEAISKSVFDITFIFVLIISYFLYKRNNINMVYSLYYKKDNKNSILTNSILQGIIAGIIGSLIVSFLGLPISFSPYLTLLLPIAIVLSFINIRYLCFSYSGAILGIVSLIINGLSKIGLNIPTIDIDISGLIALVAILHLMESILITIGGAENSIPIIVRKNGKYTVGFLMQKYWPLPFALLILQIGTNITEGMNMPTWWPLLKPSLQQVSNTAIYGLFPIAAILGYGNLAISELPKQKAKKSGLRLGIYSILLLIISIISVKSIIIKIVGIILMPMLHELIILLDQIKERNSEPLYTLPEKGVRVVVVKPDGHGEKMGLESGDIIQKINNIRVLNYHQMQVILDNYYTFLWIEVKRLNGEVITLEYKAYPDGINTLNIVPLPERPRFSFDIDQLQDYGFLKKYKNTSR